MNDAFAQIQLPIVMKRIPHSLSFIGILSQVAFAPPAQALLPPKPLTNSPYKSISRSFLPKDQENHSLHFSLTNWAWGKGATKKNAVPTTLQNEENVPGRVRIGIIGGGIAGVSCANALAKRLFDTPDGQRRYQIVVLEGDPRSAAAIACSSDDEGHDSKENFRSTSPEWQAATAKNANSMVPGAAMHVFSRKSVMWQVIKDTVKEWYFLKKEALEEKLSFGKPKTDKVLATTLLTNRRDDFAFTPPYFALHLLECLGPSATPEERASFLRYLKGYLYATVLLGDQAADRRAKMFCDLAKANRAIFLEEAENLNKNGYKVEFTRGFLALYRNLKSAEKSMQESIHHGEEARLLEWEEAVKHEPRLENLPMAPLYAVHRPNDLISGCESFIRAWTRETRSLGVEIHGPTMVETLETNATKKKRRLSKKDSSVSNEKARFRAICKDGSSYDFDVVILAAGIHTAILASRLDVGDYVPIYPLRGFSLTMNAWQQEKPKGNLLKQSFSIDSMYCSSVTPWMARWAGFGEFAGYPHKSDTVSSLGPGVLSRYAMNVFPDAVNANASATLTCSRPVSPDDLPLVGAIPKLPGLFVHCGHGTLGWTTGLATGRCVAQTVVESLSTEQQTNRPKQDFKLPGGIVIERKALSPSRFV